ncbi:dienelactone hydrolase family protein [Microbacterium sp. NPDC019599]|uniref:dienelactone hydrolase family protein n=1 Tax=Microbacterium sp. NPDC019599 TaxID=3154690 RepID=UPI0033D0E744
MDGANEISFERRRVKTADIEHDVHFGPVRGPGVLLMHELAGLTDNTKTLAAEIAASGFTVALPHLFGRAGPSGPRAMLTGAAGLIGRCIAREMSLLVADHPERGTTWLKAAVSELAAYAPSPRGVGVIGMCATGAFAMATVLDPAVGAVVGSQPALPAWRRRSWGIPGGDEQLAKRKTPLLVLRFRKDRRSAKDRVERLPQLLEDPVSKSRVGPEDPGLPHCDRGIEVWTGARSQVVWADGSGHSVLNFDRVDLAVAEAMRFLHANLDPADSRT